MSVVAVLRILHIEDNIGDVVALRRSITRLDPAAEISAISRGEDALDMIGQTASGQFGLVLVDINLPGLSGIDLLRTLKKKTVVFGAPTFVLSSSQSRADVNSSYKHGADGYLVNPFDSIGYRLLAKFLVDVWDGRPDAHYDGLRVPHHVDS